MASADQPLALPWLQEVRRFQGGNLEGAFLCRDTRTGALVVRKTFWNTKDGAETPELEVYRNLPEHPRLIKCLGEYENYPRVGYTTFLLQPFCNADTLRALVTFILKRKKTIPGNLGWFLTGEVLDGLGALLTANLNHSDLHPGNVFLHFYEEEITGQYPSVILGDFGAPLGYSDYSPEKGVFSEFDKLVDILRNDGIYSRQEQNNEELFGLLDRIGSKDRNLTAQRKNLFEEFRPAVQRYVDQQEPKILPGWIERYFMGLQEKALNMSTSVPSPVPRWYELVGLDGRSQTNAELLGYSGASGVPDATAKLVFLMNNCADFFNLGADQAYQALSQTLANDDSIGLSHRWAYIRDLAREAAEKEVTETYETGSLVQKLDLLDLAAACESLRKQFMMRHRTAMQKLDEECHNKAAQELRFMSRQLQRLG